MSSLCRSCREKIEFIKDWRGRWIVIDVNPPEYRPESYVEIELGEFVSIFRHLCEKEKTSYDAKTHHNEVNQPVGEKPERLSKKMEALILDTETTDLSPNRSLRDDQLPSIIEFYGELINLETGTVLSELEVLVKPPKLISEEVTKITHITNEMVANKPPFKDVAESIFSFIESAPLVIAHNASFDKEVLDIEANRLNYKIKWPRVVCSVEQSCYLVGRRLSLGNLYEHLFEERFSDAHRGRNDVKALSRCCVEMFKRNML